MRKFLQVICLLIGSQLPTLAQQDAQFSQYMFNKLSFNPAYAGMRKAVCFNTLYRNQWLGFPGSPKNVLVSGDVSLNAFGGVGLVLLSDQLGLDKTSIAKLSYSFHIPLGIGTLGLGAEAGTIQKSFGNNWVYNDENDPNIPLNTVTDRIWDMGIGVYYEVERQLYFGISSSHIPQSNFLTTKTSFYNSKRHYFLTAGFSFNAFNPNIEIKPSMLAKTDAASTQIDFNTIVMWRRNVWVGASYRLTDAFVLMGGFQQEIGASLLKIGYSYDITTSALKHYSSGAHEVMVSVCTPLRENPRITTWQSVRHMHPGGNPGSGSRHKIKDFYY